MSMMKERYYADLEEPAIIQGDGNYPEKTHTSTGGS